MSEPARRTIATSASVPGSVFSRSRRSSSTPALLSLLRHRLASDGRDHCLLRLIEDLADAYRRSAEKSADHDAVSATCHRMVDVVEPHAEHGGEERMGN